MQASGLVTNIFQNILLSVQQNKELQTGLEQIEDYKMMTIWIYAWTIHLKVFHGTIEPLFSRVHIISLSTPDEYSYI